MTDVEDAARLFREAELSFPTIPAELSTQLKKRDKWVFSTREIEIWPYNLQEYVSEFNEGHVEDYVVLSHSGHGVNSYAIQYYVVRGGLGMFLHLGWGGVYMDATQEAAKIRHCFSLADQIVPAAQMVPGLGAEERLLIVGSDFYGSSWSAPGESRLKEDHENHADPAELLAEVLHWLTSSRT